VKWYWKDEEISELYKQRLMAEAHGLRGILLFQTPAGSMPDWEPTVNCWCAHCGSCFGPVNPDDYKIPRSTFNQLV